MLTFEYITANLSLIHSSKAQLAEANKTIEGLQAADKDIEAVRKAAAEYKAKAEQAEKDLSLIHISQLGKPVCAGNGAGQDRTPQYLSYHTKGLAGPKIFR